MRTDTLYAAHAIDGTLVLQAALAAGCDIDLFPRQVMTCWHPSAPTLRRSFVHGVPEATTLSGATYAQDKRVSRALLERAGLPVVKGATFSFRGPRAALRYTLRTGFPVHLRMAVENSIQPNVLVATGRRSFLKAFNEIRRLDDQSTASATNLTRSAYALTGLLDPVDDGEGNRLWAPSTRVLVERLPRRWRRFQALLLGDEVVAVVGLGRTTLRSEDNASPYDATGALTPGQLLGARAAAASVPGLDIARVEVVAPTAGRAHRGDRFRIRDVSERPGLSLFDAARPGSAQGLASRILRRAGLVNLGSPVEDRTITVEFEEVNDPNQLARALQPLSRSAEVQQIEGTVSLQLSANVDRLTQILAGVLGPGIDGCHAMHLRVRSDTTPG